MSDLISRQQAMALRFTRAINEDGIVYVPLGEYLKGIKSLPSVQQWIPCDEHLPKKDNRYLVTNDGWGEWIVDWNAWVNGQWLYNSEPIAWMPLPEPYQGEKE